MIRFIEIINSTNSQARLERTADPSFRLGEVWISEKYVVSVQEALGYKSLLREGLLPEGLENAHSFTTITTHHGSRAESHVVVGSPEVVASRLGSPGRSLLKG
jgi:hypothetical protein